MQVSRRCPDNMKTAEPIGRLRAFSGYHNELYIKTPTAGEMRRKRLSKMAFGMTIRSRGRISVPCMAKESA